MRDGIVVRLVVEGDLERATKFEERLAPGSHMLTIAHAHDVVNVREEANLILREAGTLAGEVAKFFDDGLHDLTGRVDPERHAGNAPLVAADVLNDEVAVGEQNLPEAGSQIERT